LFQEEEERGLAPALLSSVEQLQEGVAFQLGLQGGTGRLVDLRV